MKSLMPFSWTRRGKYLMKELKTLAELSECSPGDQVSFIALLVDIKSQNTKDGREYVRLYFRDDKAAISVPLWNNTLEGAKDAYLIDTIYCIVGVTKEYQGNILLDRILSATIVSDEHITKRLKQHLYKRASEENIDFILKAINGLKETPYGPYVTAIYGDGTKEDERFTALLKAYASINYHDNYPGGFINHIGDMLHIAGTLKTKFLTYRCEDVWNVDWQYITAAIMLHDIGKLQTYTAVTDYTIRFKDDCVLDHNTIGVGMLYQINSHLPEEQRCDYKTFQHLAYTICYHDDKDKLLSHKRLEDKIIAYIDGLDATLAVACSMEV